MSDFFKKYKGTDAFNHAQKLIAESKVTLIWYTVSVVFFKIDEDAEPKEINLNLVDGKINWPTEVDAYFLAAAIYYIDEMKDKLYSKSNDRTFTRKGMIDRVIAERREKAYSSHYKIKLGLCLYGPHTLMDESNKRYDITIWSFEDETGYIDNVDWKTNKLATTKHILFLLHYIKSNPSKVKNLKKQSQIIEITLDPINEYNLTYKYNGKLNVKHKEIIKSIFGNKTHLALEKFVLKSNKIAEIDGKNNFIVRPEVYEKISAWHDKKYEEKNIKKWMSKPMDFTEIKADLFPYQKQGIEFCTFKKGAILADEMGLGKTIQAIGIALQKRKYYDVKKTLIICPSSVKYQWKKEIEKFTNEIAIVIDGLPAERKRKYHSNEAFFYITNYEAVLRDKLVIDDSAFDFIILDEAQRIKNYEAKSSIAITRLNKNHGLVITGTPIENKLVDLYSIMLFVDRYKMTPLWEFSYQYCRFDLISKNKINGYYDLKNLSEYLSSIMIRRQKRNVMKDLPSIVEQNVYVHLHPEQSFIHSGMKNRLAQILAKKYKTPFDYEQIMLILNNMRRVSDSTFLIDKETNFSSKLIELEHILMDQLCIKEEVRKVIIFSEWIDTHTIIEAMLNRHGIGYAKLTGKVNPKKRGDLIKVFETEKDCKVFLSTEAGGAGLNLQFADTLINFEIPWNPAKKSQRIGRIDRIGQKSKKLHIFNLICKDSIEMYIASGLLLKQSLFDSVLDESSKIDTVDFSQEGRAQFIKQLEEIFNEESKDFISVSEEEQQDKEVLDTDPVDELEFDIVNLSDTPEKESEKFTPQNPALIDDQRAKQMENIMAKGMDFMKGFYEMVSGDKTKEMPDFKFEINKETGEVMMRGLWF